MMIKKLLLIALNFLALILGWDDSVNATVGLKNNDFQEMPVYQPSPEPLPAELDKKSDLFNPDLEPINPDQTVGKPLL